MGEARTRVYRQGHLDAEDFPLAQVSDYLEQPDTIVCVNFCTPNEAQLHELASELGLHEPLAAGLGWVPNCPRSENGCRESPRSRCSLLEREPLAANGATDHGPWTLHSRFVQCCTWTARSTDSLRTGDRGRRCAVPRRRRRSQIR